MRPLDGHPQPPGQHGGLSAVVDVAVGEENFLNDHPGLRGDGLQVIDVAAWVDKCRAARLGTGDQGAVLRKGRDRQDLKFHADIIAEAAASTPWGV